MAQQLSLFDEFENWGEDIGHQWPDLNEDHDMVSYYVRNLALMVSNHLKRIEDKIDGIAQADVDAI